MTFRSSACAEETLDLGAVVAVGSSVVRISVEGLSVAEKDGHIASAIPNFLFVISNTAFREINQAAPRMIRSSEPLSPTAAHMLDPDTYKYWLGFHETVCPDAKKILIGPRDCEIFPITESTSLPVGLKHRLDGVKATPGYDNRTTDLIESRTRS